MDRPQSIASERFKQHTEPNRQVALHWHYWRSLCTVFLECDKKL